MAWPTVEDVQAAYEKLNDDALYDKIDRALRFAIARVKGAFSQTYDVSTWDDTTPPLLKEIALLLAYGYFAPRVHTGAKLSASDEAAKDARDYAEELLKKLREGEINLSDESDQDVPIRAVRGYVHKRTSKPMFTVGPIEDQAILPVDGADAWST